MIKKQLLIVVFILFIFLVGVSSNGFVKNFAIGILNSVRSEYFHFVENVRNKIKEHFFQREEIIALRAKVALLEKEASLLPAYKNKLNHLLEENSLSPYNVNLQLVEALSYVRLDDYSKVWLEFPSFKKDKIYGLLYQGKSAGIAVEKYGRPMGLLQSDADCKFSIYIGKDKIPGVIFGNKEIMIVKYIPPWLEPKKGEEVVTSGLDDIFFEGVKVGRVMEVYDEKMYKSAVVKPYVKIKIPSFLHAILN